MKLLLSMVMFEKPIPEVSHGQVRACASTEIILKSWDREQKTKESQKRHGKKGRERKG